MGVRKVHRFVALLLALTLVVTGAVQGVAAADMTVKMAAATADMPMPNGDCGGCSGDDPGMLAACSAACGISAVLPLVATVPGAITVAPPAVLVISVSGLHRPPDPYPPRSTLLS